MPGGACPCTCDVYEYVDVMFFGFWDVSQTDAGSTHGATLFFIMIHVVVTQSLVFDRPTVESNRSKRERIFILRGVGGVTLKPAEYVTYWAVVVCV